MNIKSNKKITKFRPRIRSRHPSHSVLRSRFKRLPVFPFRSIIRLGSLTEVNKNISPCVDLIELNKVEAIRNSSSKLRMKNCFTQGGVQTAKWWVYNQGFVEEDNTDEKPRVKMEDLHYPIVAKSFFGSRGRGNTKIDNVDELKDWMKGKNLHNYIFEVFHNYAREYRLHVTNEGCFYACRKVMKRDTPDENKWFRNDVNCNWIREDSENQELFDKPKNWDSIIEHCVKALKSVGLDFGACDLRVQSSKGGSNNPHFIVVEINSAPSFGNITAQKYIEVIPKLLRRKHREWKNIKS